MKPVPLVAALLALSLVLVATAGAVPPPQNDSVPTAITLVGARGGTPDPLGLFTVTIRDFGNNPVPSVAVFVDFSACSDIRIAATQPYPGLVVDCSFHTVRALTDARGVARFDIVGSSLGGLPASVHAVKIYDGTSTFSLSANTFDLDGVGGVGANDLAMWVGDFLGGVPRERSDYDDSGALSANDLALWIDDFLTAGSSVSARDLPGGLCP